MWHYRNAVADLECAQQRREESEKILLEKPYPQQRAWMRQGCLLLRQLSDHLKYHLGAFLPPLGCCLSSKFSLVRGISQRLSTSFRSKVGFVTFWNGFRFIISIRVAHHLSDVCHKSILWQLFHSIPVENLMVFLGWSPWEIPSRDWFLREPLKGIHLLMHIGSTWPLIWPASDSVPQSFYNTLAFTAGKSIIAVW